MYNNLRNNSYVKNITSIVVVSLKFSTVENLLAQFFLDRKFISSVCYCILEL